MTKVDFQERDLALLRGLFESRVMTLTHAAALYFDGRGEAAKKRIQKLKAAGAVRERPRRAYEPSVLFITRRGFEVVSQSGAIAEYPTMGWASLEKRVRVSPLTLRHELEVMEVKTAMVAAVSKVGTHQVIEFSTWPKLFQFPTERNDPRTGRRCLLVKPDGFLRLGEPSGEDELSFFIEVDRSTESQGVLALKGWDYRVYYRSGGLAARFGAPRSAFEEFPFRVLMIFRNAERRNNTAEALLQLTPPITQQVWLSTYSEVVAEPLGAIWLRPKDYLEVTRGTLFDPGRPRDRTYRRQPEREEMIENKVKKLCLLDT